jgi:hypothetical protein
MHKRLVTSLFAAALSLTAASAVMAQPVPDPGHPRVNEVTGRLDNQAGRINAGVADGQINAHQAARDRAIDNRVSNQMARDEARHDGHLTRAEDRHLNHELNHDSRRIHAERHP